MGKRGSARGGTAAPVRAPQRTDAARGSVLLYLALTALEIVLGIDNLICFEFAIENSKRAACAGRTAAS